MAVDSGRLDRSGAHGPNGKADLEGREDDLMQSSRVTVIHQHTLSIGREAHQGLQCFHLAA